MSGRYLVSLGLVLNMVGVILVGWIVLRGSVGVIASGGPAFVPKTATAKTAHPLGWSLLAAGFLVAATRRMGVTLVGNRASPPTLRPT